MSVWPNDAIVVLFIGLSKSSPMANLVLGIIFVSKLA